MPFVILGVVVLLVLGGVGLFFALNNNDPTPIASSTTAVTTQSTETTADTETSTEDTGSPQGSEPNFPESEGFANGFIQLMADGNYDGAHAILCEDGRDATDGDGFADGQALADDFFGFLAASSVSGSETTDVFLDPDDIERDVVELDITTDVGSVPMALSILKENGGLTICGYSTP